MVRCSKFGITPAWAGKSLFPAGNALCPWDHPRVGGEKSLILATRTALMGSPPRGRGKASCFHVLSRSSGITPAWAGKSLFDMVINSLLEDHPRVGGEKFQKPIDMLQDMGSPPRGRGKVLEFALVFRWCRITPAWAGKSSAPLKRRRSRRDHPRVGGEKRRKLHWQTVQRGSPPRGRGKGCGSSVLPGGKGITPAWAGKSPALGYSRRSDWDHPRVGGEKELRMLGVTG